MAKLQSDIDKWDNEWHRKASMPEKILFAYLCDNCDAGGFIKYDYERFKFHTNLHYSEDELRECVEGLKGIEYAEGWFWITDRITQAFPNGVSRKTKTHADLFKAYDRQAKRFKRAPKVLYACLRKPPKAAEPVAGNAPTFDEFYDYCKDNGFEHIACKAYRYYNDAGWIDGRGKPVLRWKQKLQSVWFDAKKNPPPRSESTRSHRDLEDVTK